MMLLSMMIGVLLTASVAVAAGATAAAIASTTLPIVIHDGTFVGNLTLAAGDEPADAIYRFVEEHALSEEQHEELLDGICSTNTCNRREALVFQTEVVLPSSDDTDTNHATTTFAILENAEPADAAHEFVTEHGLPLGYRNALLVEACAVVECTRTVPVVWRKKIRFQNSGDSDDGSNNNHDDHQQEVEITLLEGEEVADVIYNTLLPYHVSREERLRVMEAAKREGVVYSRELARIFSTSADDHNSTIIMDTTSSIPPFHLYDDGMEPIDALYQWTIQYGVSDADFDALYNTVVPKMCAATSCVRMQPIVYQSQSIASATGKNLGSFAVLRNEEPIDAVDHFVQVHGLDVEHRDTIMDMVCPELPCNRTRPIVWRKTIDDGNGNALGSITVLEDEEVADAAHRFLRESTIPLDRNGLRNYLFQQACSNARVKCSRLVANIVDRDIVHTNGTSIGHLIIQENQEPADTIYYWAKEIGLVGSGGGDDSNSNSSDDDSDEDYVLGLIADICSDTKGITCRRLAPLVKSIPLTSPDGNHVGVFELMLRQEPIDALYGFFSRHGLFTLSWDIKLVLAQLCAIDGIECNRHEAIKFRSDNFTMGSESFALTIPEDEEVIDVLYRKRLELNLSIEDQAEAFHSICKDSDVHCSRSRAVVYSMHSISILDYARFGNETCARKFAGAQYLSSFAESTLGGGVASLLQDNTVGFFVEHPLMGPMLLGFALLLVRVVLKLIGRKKKLSPGVVPVVYLYTFFLISVFFTMFIEPLDDIDVAVHLQEGRLPDLYIYEGQEAADAVLKWGKEAARKHHPIIRQPIHYEILDKICSESDAEAANVTCTRRRAWEGIDMGAITLFGNPHEIEYWNPLVVPGSSAESSCPAIGIGNRSGNVNNITCLQHSAQELCRRLFPKPAGCEDDVSTIIHFLFLLLRSSTLTLSLFPRLYSLRLRRTCQVSSRTTAKVGWIQRIRTVS